MKILFYAHCYFDTPTGVGIQKKIDAQVKALRQLGHTVHHFGYMEHDGIKGFCMDDGTNRSILYPIEYYGTIQFWTAQTYLAKRIKQKGGYDILYMRPPRLSPHSIRLFAAGKHIGAKTILEIPAYPYIKDYINRNFYSAALLLIDQITGLFVRRYLDRIVSFTRKTTIFGVPVKTIGNGIDLTDKSVVDSNNDNEILNIIAPASMNVSQGYDRIIKGLVDYKPKHNHPKFDIRIVGSGPALPDLKLMAKRLNVEKYITFTGVLKGKSFDDEINNADVGIGALGKHRIGQAHTSIIKVPEFCAYGLPFIIGYDDINVHGDQPWVYTVPPNDEAIDISDLIDFYLDAIKVNDYKARMYEYAVENLTWDKQMAIAIDFRDDL